MTTFNASLVQQAAASAAAAQQHPAGALYVVATPIGNLADLTLRAVHLLTLADTIACEDTRHSAPLLRLLGVDKPLLALHEHNERAATDTVLQRLAAGQRVVLVSDAGTPAVSDPGATLVAGAHSAGFRVIPIPGASSAVAAVSVAGDVSATGFQFVGFLPARGAERHRALKTLADNPVAQVVFEAPHRIAELLAGLAAACGARQVTVCRELTKQFEQVHTRAASEWPAWLADDPNRSRGEFVLVLHGLPPAVQSPPAQAHDAVLQPLLHALPLKQAVALAVEITGAARNALYERALALKRDGATEGEGDREGT